jgi:hypothetical protein
MPESRPVRSVVLRSQMDRAWAAHEASDEQRRLAGVRAELEYACAVGCWRVG